MPGPLVIEEHPGPVISHHGRQLTLFAKAYRIQTPKFVPFVHGGLVWIRPASVLVTEADGRETVIPVQDPTRQILWALSGIVVLMTLAAGLLNNRYRRKLKNGR